MLSAEVTCYAQLYVYLVSWIRKSTIPVVGWVDGRVDGWMGCRVGGWIKKKYHSASIELELKLGLMFAKINQWSPPLENKKMLISCQNDQCFKTIIFCKLEQF